MSRLLKKWMFTFCRMIDPYHFRGPVFVFYKPSSRKSKYYLINDGIKIVQHRKFDNSKTTMIYIHGFLVDTKASYNKVIIRAYKSRQDHNVIALDWSTGRNPSYFYNSLPRMEKTGIVVAEALMKMVGAGLDLSKLHIVGHSLGAQMCGLIGRTIKQSTNNKLVIKRISGLDPAYPGFYGEELQGLSSMDAEFVDIIHTDGGFLGVPDSIGTADFFPNSGRAPQPGCWTTPVIVHVCSHARAWFLWAESVANKNAQQFLAVKAKSWDDFKSNHIEETNSNFIMGINCPSGISGDFYLQTNRRSPFARGKDGTRYIPAVIKEDEEMYCTNTFWLKERRMVILQDKRLVKYWRELTKNGTSGLRKRKTVYKSGESGTFNLLMPPSLSQNKTGSVIIATTNDVIEDSSDPSYNGF